MTWQKILSTFLFLFVFISANAQDDALSFSDSGNGVLTFSDDEQQGSSSNSSANQFTNDNFSITVFSDLVTNPGNAAMRQIVEENLYLQFSTKADPKGNVLVCDYPYYFIRANGASILVTMSEVPRKFTESEVSWIYKNSLMQRAFDTHEAYVHIEMVQTPFDYDMGQAYEVLGKLAASFTPHPDYIPDGKFIRGYIAFPLKEAAVYDTPEMITKLLGDNPLEIFNQKFVFQSDQKPQANPKRPTSKPGLPSDAMMQVDAMKQSQKSFDTFRREMRTRKGGWSYQVQTIVRDDHDDRSEILWLDVMNISGPMIEGKVSTRPRILTELDRGQPIKVPLGDMINWMITNGEDGEYGVDPAIQIITQPELN